MERTIVFRALPLKRDARTSRYKEYVQGHVILNTWENNYLKSHGIDKFKIGRNKLPKWLTYPLYLFYLFLFSLIKLRDDDRVICMELDTFLPVFLGSFWKKNIIYLDIVDPIGQTKFRNQWFSKIFDYIEYYVLVFHKYNIVPILNRISYYKDRLNKCIRNCNFLLVENVPRVKAFSVGKNRSYDIGYFGTLDNSRGLVELIQFSLEQKLTLLIAGMGPLEDYIKGKASSSGKHSLEFIGAFSQDEIESLYARVSFSWAYYTHNILLHKYASPNKYYEHLAFKTPLIINRFVPISNKIRDMSTGIVVEDSLELATFEMLSSSIKSFDHESCDFTLWDEQYAMYSVNFKEYESAVSIK
jgi:glycosyltransferase involved in cell wall biosynthesis